MGTKNKQGSGGVKKKKKILSVVTILSQEMQFPDWREIACVNLGGVLYIPAKEMCFSNLTADNLIAVSIQCLRRLCLLGKSVSFQKGKLAFTSCVLTESTWDSSCSMSAFLVEGGMEL